jgi:hypothetical protein
MSKMDTRRRRVRPAVAWGIIEPKTPLAFPPVQLRWIAPSNRTITKGSVTNSGMQVRLRWWFRGTPPSVDRRPLARAVAYGPSIRHGWRTLPNQPRCLTRYGGGSHAEQDDPFVGEPMIRPILARLSVAVIILGATPRDSGHSSGRTDTEGHR